MTLNIFDSLECSELRDITNTVVLKKFIIYLPQLPGNPAHVLSAFIYAGTDYWFVMALDATRGAYCSGVVCPSNLA